MRVRVESDRDAGMPEPLADNLGGNTRCQGERGMGVPQVMKPNFRKIACANQTLESLSYRVRIQNAALSPAEHEPEIGEGGPESQTAHRLIDPVLPQGVNRLRV